MDDNEVFHTLKRVQELIEEAKEHILDSQDMLKQLKHEGIDVSEIQFNLMKGNLGIAAAQTLNLINSMF